MAESVYKGKTLLITGGTGSFGNTVLKHFLSTDIGEIRIFSRDEGPGTGICRQGKILYRRCAEYSVSAGRYARCGLYLPCCSS